MLTIPYLDKSHIQTICKKSQILRSVANVPGVSFEEDLAGGDTLYIEIENDPISDLFYIIEVICDSSHQFLLTVNQSQFALGVIVDCLSDAIEIGKSWAADKDLVTILESTRPSAQDVARELNDRLDSMTMGMEFEKPGKIFH